MGIFDRFPSTKLNDINLDWILKKIRSLRGGTANQVLAKASNRDFDFKWVSGGGGGGTSDYNDLVNQPQINSVTLSGNQSALDLGLVDLTALNSYRTATVQDAIDAGKQNKITASGMLKGDGDGGVSTATAGTDYLEPTALNSYRTASAQDTIDEGKQNKIAASGMLKGDGDGGISTATAGTDYLAPTALNSYRTASAQDLLDAAQDANVGIVITGARPSMVVSAGQYVIVRGSTITSITDGLYTAVNALSPSTDVTAADLTAVSGGGLNNVMERGLRVRVIAKHPTTATPVSAGGFVDFSLDTSASPNFIDSIGIYASRPQLLITNIFRNDGKWTVTIFNPTSSNLTLNTAREVRILEFYNT